MKTCRFITFSSIFGVLLAISSIATADLKTGLVAYYPFNGNANDASGNGNNGTVYGATLTTDRFGKANSAYYFGATNGTSNDYYIDLGIPSKIGFPLGNSSRTTSAWFNTDCDIGNLAFILSWGSGVYGTLWRMDINQNKIHFWGGYHDAIGTTNIECKKWYFVAMSYDGTTLKIYLNGAPEQYTLTFNSSPINTADGHAGISWSAFPDAGYNFKGSIDEVRVYNRVLSDQEIQQLYKESSLDQYFDVTTIPDVNGDGVMDQAVLTQSAGKYYLRTINGANGKQLKSLSLGTATGVTLSGLTVIPDINGDSVSDFALLVLSGGNYSLRVVDGVTGNQLRQVSLGAATGLTPIALTVVDDANANTYKDISILIKNADGSNVLQIRDGLMLSVLKTFKLK